MARCYDLVIQYAVCNAFIILFLINVFSVQNRFFNITFVYMIVQCPQLTCLSPLLPLVLFLHTKQSFSCFYTSVCVRVCVCVVKSDLAFERKCILSFLPFLFFLPPIFHLLSFSSCLPVCMCEARRPSIGVGLSLHYVTPKDQIQAARIFGKCFYLLS